MFMLITVAFVFPLSFCSFYSTAFCSLSMNIQPDSSLTFLLFTKLEELVQNFVLIVLCLCYHSALSLSYLNKTCSVQYVSLMNATSWEVLLKNCTTKRSAFLHASSCGCQHASFVSLLLELV